MEQAELRALEAAREAELRAREAELRVLKAVREAELRALEAAREAEQRAFEAAREAERRAREAELRALEAAREVEDMRYDVFVCFFLFLWCFLRDPCWLEKRSGIYRIIRILRAVSVSVFRNLSKQNTCFETNVRTL